MIIQGNLSAAQQDKSQRNYYKFCALNGFSYMCVGETMMILFAVRLGAPNWAISAMGAMIFIGFLLLPLGLVLTRHYGAAMTQAIAWVCRNLAGCFIASSALVDCLGFHLTAVAMILLGAFAFYGFRAAGVIMSQPLIGGISSGEKQAAVVGIGNAIFYIMSISALVMLNFILKWKSNIWILASIMVVGAAMGAGCFHFFRQIDEPDALKKSAQKPILPQVRRLWRIADIRHQVYVVFAMNTCIAMTVPMAMLALKRGYGIDDHTAMFYSIFQFCGCALFSYLVGRLSNLFGPRQILLASYAMLLASCLAWYLSPDRPVWLFCCAMLVVCGGARAALEVAQAHYFIKNTSRDDQVAASILISVCGGFLAGVAATGVSAMLLRLLVKQNTIECFRNFFLAVLLFILPGLWLIWKLKPLAKSRRFLRIHFRHPR